jgi:beta-glucosidase-like glycosyl hydrolase
MTATDLSLEAAIGQLICPTLFGGQLRPQAYDESAVLADLAAYGWGGYILFHAPADVIAERTATLQAHSAVPLLLAADMEHGAGQQADGLTIMPPAMAYGATGDPACSAALGAWTASEARRIGVNWVFAPVADVTNNPYNPIIAIRSFGGDPQAVADHVAAFVRGCQGQGVLACAKHFPGHGDTATDSHSRLGAVAADRQRLEAVEWPPFKAAIAAGVASVMSAHLAVPALDAADVPATLSKAVMTGLLRKEWGFEGLIITDALLMGGIVSVCDPAEAGVEALLAGCDMLLMPPDPIALFNAVRQAVQDGRLPESRVFESAARILAAKAQVQAPPGPLPEGSAADHAATVARRAVTLARGSANWAFPAGWGVVTVLDGATAESLSPWLEGLPALQPGGTASVGADADEATWQTLAEAAESWPGLLFAVASPIRVSKDRSLLPQGLVERLHDLAKGRPFAVLTFSSPFLAAQFPSATAALLTYGTTADQQRAAIAALRSGDFPGQVVVTMPETLAAPVAAGVQRPAEDLAPPFA